MFLEHSVHSFTVADIKAKWHKLLSAGKKSDKIAVVNCRPRKQKWAKPKNQ